MRPRRRLLAGWRFGFVQHARRPARCHVHGQRWKACRAKLALYSTQQLARLMAASVPHTALQVEQVRAAWGDAGGTRGGWRPFAARALLLTMPPMHAAQLPCRHLLLPPPLLSVLLFLPAPFGIAPLSCPAHPAVAVAAAPPGPAPFSVLSMRTRRLVARPIKLTWPLLAVTVT